MLGDGCWVMGVECWVLSVGCWMLGMLITQNLRKETRYDEQFVRMEEIESRD